MFSSVDGLCFMAVSGQLEWVQCSAARQPQPDRPGLDRLVLLYLTDERHAAVRTSIPSPQRNATPLFATTTSEYVTGDMHSSNTFLSCPVPSTRMFVPVRRKSFAQQVSRYLGY